MKSKAIIVGAGGHARVVGATLRALGVEIAGFLDDGFNGVEEPICGASLVGAIADAERFDAASFDAYVAIGDNKTRAKLLGQMAHSGYGLPPLIHPGSRQEFDCRVGPGSHLCSGAILGTQVKVGKGVIVNTGSSVDHEGIVEDFVHLAPGVALAGRVRVGQSAFVGIGARIAENICIGRGAVVGAGAIVLKDVPDGARVVGVHH